MNVSSVKNLNGETFSAVQDVALTDVVSSNSANWNEISAYQANSGTFLTAHQDLSDYQTTAGMTAYQPAGDYLTTGDSANFYTTANESGFISEVPVGTMNESAFGYDANDKISGYNGSAFAGGSDVPEGVMVESGLEYDNTEISGYSGSAFKDVALTDVVTANSGAWGGSALPISAGPGIKLEMVNDTLVASTDETVLFSGSNAWGYGTLTLSESLKNFERIKVLATRAFTGDSNTDRYSGPWSEFECEGIANTTAAWGAVTPVIYEGPYWKFSTFTANSTFTELNWFEGGYIKVTNPSEYAAGSTWNDGKSCGIKAVIGIKRIAGV